VELLTGLPFDDIGLAGILTVVVLLVLTGRLVSRQQLRDVQADRDYWRASADRWQDVSTRHGMTLERLLTLAETSNHALTEIQSALEHET
jgi:hypothetical protein